MMTYVYRPTNVSRSRRDIAIRSEATVFAHAYTVCAVKVMADCDSGVDYGCTPDDAVCTNHRWRYDEVVERFKRQSRINLPECDSGDLDFLWRWMSNLYVVLDDRSRTNVHRSPDPNTAAE